MNALGQLAMTAAVTAAGLFVYDALRSKPADRAESDDAVVGDARLEARVDRLERREAPAAPREAADPTLAARLAALERRFEGSTPAPAASHDAPRASSPEPAGRPSRSFDERDVTDFRAMMEEVERRKRIEETGQAVRAQIAALNLGLNATEEDAVVVATTDLREKNREIWSGLPRDEAARQERVEAMQRAREEWEKVVRGAVPAEPADKIVAVLGRGMGIVGPRPEVRQPPGTPTPR